ncbi:hypothetical protein PQO01_20405 [Lentisphaera marina]|uniref:hypothetical protein n=1 Tax=Lentisphaera marina TaxID=1111041 RepID=UPI002365C7C0|nr:hypothetical protein [Lentisphaera marina]MDD7987323.1 hypothetical protein [Lentisphaera marina]
MPENWEALESKYAKNPNPIMQVLLRELNQKFGSVKANIAALEELMNEKNDVLLRRESLASLIKQKYKPLLTQLPELLDGPLAVDAIRAYSHYDSLSGAQFLLKRYDSFDSAQKQAVIETLATRRSYGQELLKAIKQGSIQKNEISAYVARSLRNLWGKDFNEIFAEKKSTSSDKKALIKKFKALINSASFKKC